jgi:hypothetical protein
MDIDDVAVIVKFSVRDLGSNLAAFDTVLADAGINEDRTTV